MKISHRLGRRVLASPCRREVVRAVVFDVPPSLATMASGAEAPMAAARVYRHGTMKAAGRGSKGLWVGDSLKNKSYLSFATKEY